MSFFRTNLTAISISSGYQIIVKIFGEMGYNLFHSMGLTARVTMIKREKIEEWIKEVESRPSSAPVIVQYIANRLRDLTARNEEILAELIALQSEKRVEEYEKRIAHLEYQLDLIKRQGEGGITSDHPAGSTSSSAAGMMTQNRMDCIMYDGLGRLLRLELFQGALKQASQIAIFDADFRNSLEAPRLLAVSPSEELLFVFSSGRIDLTPASALPSSRIIEQTSDPQPGGEKKLPWQVGPVKPHAGERLACVTPVSNLARVDCFIQVSRRGFIKKIRSGMAGSIFENRYIGAGIKKPSDQTFEVILAKNEDQIVLLTSEGYLIALEVKSLPVSIEEVIRLDPSDHLVSCFIYRPEDSILVMTNAGKILHLTSDRIELSGSFKTKGQAVFSGQRRAQGARVVGAALIHANDWGAVCDLNGEIRLHEVQPMLGSGVLAEQSQPIAFTAFNFPQDRG